MPYYPLPGSPPPRSPLESIGHTIMTRTPDVNALYNAANTAYHLATGTAGTHGDSPSLVGRILAAFSGNPHNLGPAGGPGWDASARGALPGMPVAPYAAAPAPNSPPNPYAGLAAIMAQNPSGGDWRTNASRPPPSPLQQGLTAVGNYAQGTVNSYGGGSDLQQLSLLRQLGLDNTPTNNGLFGSYAAPWNLAQASGATAGGGINPMLRYGGASPGFLVH